MKETLKLTGERGQDIIYGYDDEYVLVEEKIVGTSRWCTIHEIVVKRVEDGKFFKSGYRQGATEIQDERPYEYGDALFEEVSAVEKTVIVYE